MYCYLKKDCDKVLKFHLKILSYFEISASFFYAPPSNKRHTLKLPNYSKTSKFSNSKLEEIRYHK